MDCLIFSFHEVFSATKKFQPIRFYFCNQLIGCRERKSVKKRQYKYLMLFFSYAFSDLSIFLFRFFIIFMLILALTSHIRIVRFSVLYGLSCIFLSHSFLSSQTVSTNSVLFLQLTFFVVCLA